MQQHGQPLGDHPDRDRVVPEHGHGAVQQLDVHVLVIYEQAVPQGWIHLARPGWRPPLQYCGPRCLPRA